MFVDELPLQAATPGVRKRLHFERVERGSKFRAKPKSPRVIYASAEGGKGGFRFRTVDFRRLGVLSAVGESERRGRRINFGGTGYRSSLQSYIS